MTSYVSPFTGQTINPSSVSYERLQISADTTLEWPINGTTGTPISSIVDVSATTTNLHLALPPASQVSTGQTVLVRNIGANTFVVTDNAGGTIVSVDSGVAEFIYLIDNATVAGSWTSVVLGAGTSSANASQLAGYGLQATGITLNQAYPTVSYFSDATLPATVRAKLVLWSSGVGTITLLSAAVVGAGWFCMIRNSGTGIVTVTPAGTDTIDGNPTQQLQLTESLVLVSNGTGWNTFAYGRSNSFPYTMMALSVTGGTLTLSATQAANTVQEYAGVLASNQVIVVPSTVQLYSVTNNTTGAFTFTVKTAVGGGSTVVVAQSSSVLLVCDGTNVYNTLPTNSGGPVSYTSLTLGNGTLAIPSLKFAGDANTGLYLPSSGEVGLVVANTLVGAYSATGLAMVGAVSGTTGTFTTGVTGGTF